MHSLRLDVDNSVYSQLLAFVKQFEKDKIVVVEDTFKEEFILSSKEQVQARVSGAEKNNNFQEHNDFWEAIEKETKALK